MREEKSVFRKIFNFRNFLSLLSIVLMIVVLYFNWDDILSAIDDLGQTDPLVMLLLIPEQLFAFYACAKIFFSYFEGRGAMKKMGSLWRKCVIWFKRTFLGQNVKDISEVKESTVLRVGTELNFVSRAMPAGGVNGLAYLTFRFKEFGIPPGETAFAYFLRFVITTVFNYLQCLLAVIVLLIIDAVPESAMWVVWLATIMNLGVMGLFGAGIYIISSEKRLQKFTDFAVKIVNLSARILSFGKKKVFILPETAKKYARDLSGSVKDVKKNRKVLWGPIKWGIIYSFMEVAVYWIVAIAMGEPGLLAVIMVGEAVGSALDGIVPYGLYELGMAGIMVALGTDVGTAAVITVVARVFSLLFAVITGFFPYHRTIQTIGKEKNV